MTKTHTQTKSNLEHNLQTLLAERGPKKSSPMMLLYTGSELEKPVETARLGYSADVPTSAVGNQNAGTHKQ